MQPEKIDLNEQSECVEVKMQLKQAHNECDYAKNLGRVSANLMCNKASANSRIRHNRHIGEAKSTLKTSGYSGPILSSCWFKYIL